MGIQSAIYRTVELAGGWDGKIMRTQIYFSKSSHLFAVVSDIDMYIDVGDGAMIALAIYCTIFVHPGAVLGSSKAQRNIGA